MDFLKVYTVKAGPLLPHSKLAALEFGSPEDQTGYNAQVYLFDRVI
jgi:hypothetical protein